MSLIGDVRNLYDRQAETHFSISVHVVNGTIFAGTSTWPLSNSFASQPRAANSCGDGIVFETMLTTVSGFTGIVPTAYLTSSHSSITIVSVFQPLAEASFGSG